VHFVTSKFIFFLKYTIRTAHQPIQLKTVILSVLCPGDKVTAGLVAEDDADVAADADAGLVAEDAAV
jgi:predicted peptidase